VKICAHCALFGSHKDHTFQQESDFLEEIRRKELQLMEQRLARQTLERNDHLEEQWRTFEVEIGCRENEQLAELREEYSHLVRKITNVKEDIEQQIKLQYAAAMKAFRQEADACKREIQYGRVFDRWSADGRELLANLRGHFNSEKFNAHYRDYENFAWRQGELMLREMQGSVEKVKLNAKRTIA
jgi:predicted nucleotidyltransferase